MKSYFQSLLLLLITGVPFLTTAATSQTGDGGQSSGSIPNPIPLSQFDLPELQGISINLEEWCVDVDAYICLKKGVLELIACTKASKEHESIVAVDSTAKHIHTALLLLGAEAGSPAQRKPVDDEENVWMDVPPSGAPVDVFLVFDNEDSAKPVEKPINEFITQEDGEIFSTNTFLFAGSILRSTDNNSPNHYMADRSGNVISISTFGDEVLCLPGLHSQVNTELYWNVAGDKLPDVGTPVILRLRPQTDPGHPSELSTNPASSVSDIPHGKSVRKVPTKVFILAGQSNMEGQGVVTMNHPEFYNGGKGNLEWSMKHSSSAEKMRHLKDEKRNWTSREDVQISFKSQGKQRKGNLTIGYTGYGGNSHIGPELQFGHVVGDYFDEPVLLIKTAWGGKSLHADFRPPSSGGPVGPYYTKMIKEIHAALEDLKHDDYELAGFIWMQGWNDMVASDAITHYADHLVNLALDLRSELGMPQLPFIVGELGNGGPVQRDGNMADFRQAQRNGTARIENAVFVKTTAFARPKERSPNTTHGHHWFGNAESYFLIGDALARATIELIEN
ncbi:sialate O-acetylesterase [Verrucomicrobia bacterium]|nr:sialate O-acetylesterase [Verrucomicrobiota bacterium]